MPPREPEEEKKRPMFTNTKRRGNDEQETIIGRAGFGQGKPEEAPARPSERPTFRNSDKPSTAAAGGEGLGFRSQAKPAAAE